MTLGRGTRTAAAVAVIALALYAVVVALTGTIDPGIADEWTGGIVGPIAPDSYLWDAGLRPGQVVLWARSAGEPGGWAIQTAQANHGQPVLLGPVALALRASSLAGALALVLAVLALPVARLSERRATLLLAWAPLLAVVPVVVAYDRGPGLLAIATAVTAPWWWLAGWAGRLRPAARAAAILGLALWAGWIALRLLVPEPAVLLRNLLGAWAAAGALVLLFAGARMTRADAGAAVRALGVVDILVLAGAIIIALLLQSSGVHLVLVAGVVLLPVLLLLGTRRRLAESLDRVLLADLRERESLRATEEERARVAREIHDDALQQVAGLARGIGGGAQDPAAMAAVLDGIAVSLRGVATGLRPPALDDLGLVPALDGVRDAARDGLVELQIANTTGYSRAQRPPAEVELAVLRIVQEAVGNATRHAGATRIVVHGAIDPGAIDLHVDDDGRGIDQGAVEAAARAGRMGMASMQQRARAIGASLEILPVPGGPGTRVRLRWTR